MIGKLCKKCSHIIGRHNIIMDKSGKQKAIMCLDCDCSTMKSRNEFDSKNVSIQTQTQAESFG